MSQTRLGSFVETCTNVSVGFLTAIGTSAIVYPMYDFYPSLNIMVQLTTVFTVVAILRGYICRRFFNWLKASWNQR